MFERSKSQIIVNLTFPVLQPNKREELGLQE